jgi:2-hydroxychromene-2-carboxylate isomerase
MTTIEYYFTLNSPWAHLGSQRFMAMTKAANATVVVKPAKYGPIFAQTGGLPLPKRSPQRQAYRLMELKRWRDHLGVPIVIEPKSFPADEGAATRLVIAAALQGLDALKFSAELSRNLWELERTLSDPADIAAAAARAGIDLAALQAAAPPDAELDRIWEKNTEEGLARGVFGAPAYVLPSGEFFWGQDRLEFLERALRKTA